MGLAADERNPFLHYSLEIEAPVKRIRARWGGPFLPYAGGPQKSHPEVAEVNIYRKGILYYPGAIYFLFGYTYVIYATFIVTTLVRALRPDENFSASCRVVAGQDSNL
jgi:hypothetical protein